jgi:ABC-type Co2+ transport system permease subunit
MRKQPFLRRHSLSLVCILILLCWVVLYSRSDSSTHWGAFFGNAIADWSGLVVTVVATKFMYEKGSAESRKPPQRLLTPMWQKLQQHSLSIFLIITGATWVAVFAASDPESKWGQVVGNIVSEWTQIFGLVILTKKLIETHSKESHREQ